MPRLGSQAWRASSATAIREYPWTESASSAPLCRAWCAAALSVTRRRFLTPSPSTTSDAPYAAGAPEVVLAHGWLGFSVAPALVGTGIPLIASAHDYGHFCTTRILVYRDSLCEGPAPLKCTGCAGRFYGAPKGWAARIGVGISKRWLRRRMVAVQSVSSFVDQTLAHHFVGDGFAPERRFIVPAFVETHSSTGVGDHEMLQQLPPQPFILFVGALRPIKGVDVLIEAYRRLEKPPPLVLIGTIERDTPELPPEAIVITDAPHSVVMAAWGRAMIAVAPSVWPEPLGTVAIESASRGIPTIATAPSGMEDVLGEGGGVLIAQGDVEALARALQSLIDDPRYREEIARQGQLRAAPFAAEVVLSRYERMLQEVTGAVSSGGRAADAGSGERR